METEVSRPREHSARVGTGGLRGSKASSSKDSMISSRTRVVFEVTLPVTLLSIPFRGTQLARANGKPSRQKPARRKTSRRRPL